MTKHHKAIMALSVFAAFAVAMYDLASYPHLENGPGEEPTWFKVVGILTAANAIVQMLWWMVAMHLAEVRERNRQRGQLAPQSAQIYRFPPQPAPIDVQQVALGTWTQPRIVARETVTRELYQ